jgi:photosystem II stability/assembly factor-like uncharacterized protein
MKLSLFSSVRNALNALFLCPNVRTQKSKTIATLVFVFSIFMLKAQTWNQLPVTAPITTSSELGIHFVDDQIGYVVGTNGLASKTTNGGTTWATLTSIGAGSTSLYSTYFIDALTGFVVGDGGFIKRTDDGGATWQSVALSSTNPPPVGTDYRAVWFYNAYIGFIVGGISQVSGTILKTTDGGLTWTNISPTPNGGAGGKAFYSIFFTSPLVGYASDFDGRILKTTNGGTGGGSSWNVIHTEAGYQLNGLFFTSQNDGYAVGGKPGTNTGIVLKTSNAGMLWTPTTTIPNTRFYSDVKFFGNTGFVNGGNPINNLNGVIYKTVNAGVTWTPETINSSSGARQFRLSIPSSNTGFSSGLSGTILKIKGINEKICCDTFVSSFANSNFSSSNLGSVYTFTKPTGTIGSDIFTWDFGDGQTGTGSPITHTYPSVSNSYLATLTITRPQAGGDTCKVKLYRLINTQPCPNLVINGDFSLGNTGFTTQLPNGQRCTPLLCEEGSYCIGSNFTNKCSISAATTWPSTFDHTFGTASGSFMSIDGNTTVAGPIEVWKHGTPIPVNANTTYKFSFWAKSVYTPTQQVLNLDMAITNPSTGATIVLKPVPNTLSTTVWKEYSMLWNSGPTPPTTVNLAIRQLLPAAFSDFGVDDISFTCVSCEDFMTDVMNFGIQSTLVSGNTYKYCVSPNVSSTDIVQWDMDCNGTVDATTNSACQNFTLTGANSQICATVLHVNKPGDTCRVKVNTCLPNVPTRPCSCDTAIFNPNVSAGFTWVRTPPFTITFTPTGLLNNCDSVRWTFGNGAATANSVGSASISYTYPTAGTYNVCMFVTRTTPAGVVCRREYCISIRIDGASPVAELAMPTLNVKPNPTTQSALITLPEGVQNIDGILKLSTIEGRTLKSIPIRSTETTMDLGILPAGLYFISFYDEKGNMLTRPTKLVKQ